MKSPQLTKARIRERYHKTKEITLPTHQPSTTLMRWDVINELLKVTPTRRFLEIGVQAGLCGKRIRALEKWGVDPKPIAHAERNYNRLYRCTSDEFFHNLAVSKLFDVVLIDGLHHADQVLRDVNHALKHLSPDGSIVIHDCNPATESAQRIPRETKIWNGDCWRAVVTLRKRHDIDTFTIAADYGIGIVRRRPNRTPLHGIPEPLEYTHLEADRKRLLGLVSQAFWAERVGPPLAIGRLAVVTAIFGGRDIPIPAPIVHDLDTLVMFTDGPGSAGWNVIHEDLPVNADPRIVARRIKTLALELVEADVIVWIDGRIRLTGVPIRPLIHNALTSADVACFLHPWRHCAYEEALQCAKLGLAPVNALEAQIDTYKRAGLPVGAGLWNTMVVARRRTPTMINLGRVWWQEIKRHTARDQISLPFLLWKHEIACGSLGRDVYAPSSSRHFVRGSHAKTYE